MLCGPSCWLQRIKFCLFSSDHINRAGGLWCGFGWDTKCLSLVKDNSNRNGWLGVWFEVWHLFGAPGEVDEEGGGDLRSHEAQVEGAVPEGSELLSLWHSSPLDDPLAGQLPSLCLLGPRSQASGCRRARVHRSLSRRHRGHVRPRQPRGDQGHPEAAGERNHHDAPHGGCPLGWRGARQTLRPSLLADDHLSHRGQQDLHPIGTHGHQEDQDPLLQPLLSRRRGRDSRGEDGGLATHHEGQARGSSKRY